MNTVKCTSKFHVKLQIERNSYCLFTFQSQATHFS